MRVAIDGTHSVGKTTLHKALENVVVNWNFIPETVRQIAPKFNIETRNDWLKIVSDRERYIDFMQVMIDTQLSLEPD